MNDFDEAVRALLSDTPERPALDDLETRARRRRIRYGTTAVVAAVAIAAATVGVAGAVGHRSGAPDIAVSPTTSTTSTVPDAIVQWCAQSVFLDAVRVQLALLEQQLNDQLTRELAARSPNAGATDASHQAVLIEQSNVQQRIVRLNDSRPSSAPCPPCPSQPVAPPEPPTAFSTEFERLNASRVELQKQEHILNQELTQQLAVHSPNAGATDAAHQAVLREEIDVQQQILRLADNRPTSAGCRPAVEPGMYAPAIFAP